MQQSCDFAGTPQLKLDEWATLLRSTCGGNCRVVEPNAFSGWMRQLSVYGVAATAVKIQQSSITGATFTGSSGRAAIFTSLTRIGTLHHFRSLADAR